MTCSDSKDNRQRLYGRRQGRPLSARQQSLIHDLLPRLAIDLSRPAPMPLASLFSHPVEEVWLEIGFGAGEHLVWQAKTHPRAGLIGAEPFLNGMAQLLGRVTDDALENIRVHGQDARPLLEWLPDAALARVFILFPDPWPKARHHKRRLIAPDTLRTLARVMREGAELRIATDSSDYARATLMAMRSVPSFVWMAESPRDWRERPGDWPATRYERKAVAAGRRPTFFVFKRA